MPEGSVAYSEVLAPSRQGQFARTILQRLKDIGYSVPDEVIGRIKDDTHVLTALGMVGLDPYDPSPGLKDNVHQLLLEVVNGDRNGQENPLGWAPASITHPKQTQIPTPTPQSNGQFQVRQSAFTDPQGLTYMVQDEYMVQTIQVPSHMFHLMEQDFDGKKLPRWALAAFEMPVTVANIRSNKNEVYTKEVWDSNIPRLQGLARNNKLLGKLDHPSDGKGGLLNTCLKFQDIFWSPEVRRDGGYELWSKGYIMNTTQGRDLMTMLEAKVPADVSSRGWGRAQSAQWVDGQPASIVQSFVVDGFDAVLEGASPGASFAAGTLWQDSGYSPIRDNVSPEKSKVISIPRKIEIRRKAYLPGEVW